MSIEQSHGKARPTLPRSSDLAVVGTVEKRTAGRTSDGRFTAGNRNAEGARWKAALKRTLGPKVGPQDAELVYRDAYKIYLATLTAMPSDAAPVRAMASLHARHMAVNAYFTTKAAEAGLTTEAGQHLQELADKQSARAERTLVTCIDTATKLAAKAPKKTSIEALTEKLGMKVST